MYGRKAALVCMFTFVVGLTVVTMWYKLARPQSKGFLVKLIDTGKFKMGCPVSADGFKVPGYYNDSTLDVPLNLTSLRWTEQHIARGPTGPHQGLPAPFEPVMGKAQSNLYYRLLHIFASTLSANNLGDQFMLYDGTLIGSIRHHDFIPWDDDIDVFVNISHRSKVRALLRALSPDYRLYEGEPRDKLFTAPIDPSKQDQDLEFSRPIERWAWPFLDIAYFNDNLTHVIEWYPQLRTPMTFNRNLVVPLYFRPFGKHWYPAPRDSLGFLRTLFPNMDMCVSSRYSHAQERWISVSKKVCALFDGKYAFVERIPCSSTTPVLPDGMILAEESLVLRTSGEEPDTLHSLILPVAASHI